MELPKIDEEPLHAPPPSIAEDEPPPPPYQPNPPPYSAEDEIDKLDKKKQDDRQHMIGYDRI